MLDYSDMETPPTRDAAVQTEEQRRPYREAINPVVASYGARWRARPSRRMFAEILNFIVHLGILAAARKPAVANPLGSVAGYFEDTFSQLPSWLRLRFGHIRYSFLK